MEIILICIFRISNGCSLCGFTDALSIKSVDDEDIDYVQNFIRDKLLERISTIYEISESDYVFFFGQTFLSNPAQFEFDRGERKQLKAIVSYVKSVVDRPEGDNIGIQHFRWQGETDCETIRFFIDDPERQLIDTNLTDSKSNDQPNNTHTFSSEQIKGDC